MQQLCIGPVMAVAMRWHRNSDGVAKSVSRLHTETLIEIARLFARDGTGRDISVWMNGTISA